MGSKGFSLTGGEPTVIRRGPSGLSGAGHRPAYVETRSGSAPDERQHAPPGVLARLGVLLVAAVEEGVRRAGIGDDLVLDAGVRERAVERVDLVGRDVGVVAAVEAEHRPAHVDGAVDRRHLAPAL